VRRPEPCKNLYIKVAIRRENRSSSSLFIGAIIIFSLFQCCVHDIDSKEHLRSFKKIASITATSITIINIFSTFQINVGLYQRQYEQDSFVGLYWDDLRAEGLLTIAYYTLFICLNFRAAHHQFVIDFQFCLLWRFQRTHSSRFSLLRMVPSILLEIVVFIKRKKQTTKTNFNKYLYQQIELLMRFASFQIIHLTYFQLLKRMNLFDIWSSFWDTYEWTQEKI